MSNLDDFLERKKRKRILADLEEIDGTYTCQDDTCQETVTSAYFDVNENAIVWYCSNKHESEVKL